MPAPSAAEWRLTRRRDRHRRLRPQDDQHATWTWRSPTAGSPPSSAPTPAASRRCCGRCRGCSAPRRARCCSTARTSTRCPAKEVARRLGLLPQTSIAPDGITVADLVARGRFPHQRLLRQWSAERRGRGRRRDGRDRRHRPAADARRRALRRPAPTGVGRDGPRPADADRCCSTSRPRSSTSPTRSSVLDLCADAQRASRAARWSRSCTTSTTPAATPTTSSR